MNEKLKLPSSALTLLVGLAAPAAFAQTPTPPAPPASGDQPAEAPKPPERPAERTATLQVEGSKSSKFDLSVRFVPGVPNAEERTEIFLTVNEVPKTPHPRYGTAVPATGARLVVELLNPVGDVVARYLAHEIPLSAGKFGLHVTPPQDGMLGLNVKGRARDGKTFEGSLRFPVNVWPLPDDMMSTQGKSGSGARRPVLGK